MLSRKKNLDQYFTPLSNVPYERHTFLSIAQESNETVEQYITRLRVKAETCEFGVIDSVDEQIRDQVVEKCASNHLRCKLIGKGRTLTLKNVHDAARALGDSERQARSIEGISANVNKLSLCDKPHEKPRDTAQELHVLKVRPQLTHLNTVEQLKSILSEFPEVTSGFGKLKDYKLKIPIDDFVQPVVQPVRRVPYLRDKLSKKLDELESLDIIEKVDEPSEWMSPVVCVPKSYSDDIRLCVEMQVAKTAVKPERYTIPTVDEIVQELNNSSISSKIDWKMGYFQIEIDEISRGITTFGKHQGPYRYKRLMMGISYAPEMHSVNQSVL